MTPKINRFNSPLLATARGAQKKPPSLPIHPSNPSFHVLVRVHVVHMLLSKPSSFQLGPFRKTLNLISAYWQPSYS